MKFKESFDLLFTHSECRQKSGSFGFVKRWLVCWAKPNVPNVRLAKIELKKMCGWENKKY